MTIVNRLLCFGGYAVKGSAVLCATYGPPLDAFFRVAIPFSSAYNERMLKLWNTLSRKKEVFRPLTGTTVKMYTCGPTVYDFAHIGNLRTFIFEDVLRRTLEYSGYGVRQIMNITDVDDKIIARAMLERKPLKAITSFFTKAFFEDLKKTNVKRAECYPRATAHIKDMTALIERLIRKGLAYREEDGSIYFRIANFKPYGALSHLRAIKLKNGARVLADTYQKEEAQDFALWKAKKEGEHFWKTFLGEGRPGWHIECSAMSMRYLGATLDIHAGGVDLIFPHHENEIAQSEGATGKRFARYWVHGEHLLVDGQKMSKSLGNFYTLRDIESRGYDPLAFRYLMLTAHYRSKLNFTWESLAAADRALKNLKKDVASLRSESAPAKQAPLHHAARARERAFAGALADDLNVPRALAELLTAVKDASLTSAERYELVLRADAVLGFSLSRVRAQKIPRKVTQIVARREISRKNKQFIQSDLLRKQVEELGYKIEDALEGPRVFKDEHGS